MLILAHRPPLARDSNVVVTAPTPFHDLDEYIALPRLGGLALSLDGMRLVVAMNVLDAKRTRYVTSLWEVDPRWRAFRAPTHAKRQGRERRRVPARRIAVVHLRPTGSRRETAGSDDESEPPSALWRLPADGGEANVVATRPGGVGGVVVARNSGTFVVSSATLPGAITADDDQRRRSLRKDNKISAILHESYPIRFWDHDLGPDTPRLMVGDAPADDVETIELRDVTGHLGTALSTDEVSWSISPDGRTIYASLSIVEAGGSDRLGIVAIDSATGRRVDLLNDADHEYCSPRSRPMDHAWPSSRRRDRAAASRLMCIWPSSSSAMQACRPETCRSSRPTGIAGPVSPSGYPMGPRWCWRPTPTVVHRCIASASTAR